ncbi:MAG: hypothetical protein ACRENA_16805 [Vulcanimicrobiaceae bacterium]
MRFITAAFVGMLVFAALALSSQTRVTAQMPPATAPPVPQIVTPDAAIEGTIASMSTTGAVLQTPDGQSVRLALAPRGYLLVDPSPQALSAGMRVFAHGFPRSDGTVNVDEIDVLVPLNLMMVTPAAAQTPAPAVSPSPQQS